MREAVDAKQLALVWSRVEEASGAFEGTSDVTEQATPTSDIVTMTARFAKAQFDVTVAVTKGTHAVEGLVMRPKNNHPYAPPSYANPASFTEREVTVGAAPWALPGTLADVIPQERLFSARAPALTHLVSPTCGQRHRAPWPQHTDTASYD
jgi:hypothetical protein